MTLAASPPRRLSPRLLPLLAALLALTVLAPAGPGGRPAAQAQSPAPPQVTVNLYSSSLLFRTLPATLVTAELTGPKGRKAEGVGVGDAQGVAQVGFYTGETSILPGDTIELSRANDKPLHHWLAGIRHIRMDIKHTVTKEQGQSSAQIVLAISLTLTVLLAAKLFGLY